MQRRAALVPRSRQHLIRLHGVLAAHAKLRAAIVPYEAPAVIAGILTRLGVPARALPRAPRCIHAP